MVAPVEMPTKILRIQTVLNEIYKTENFLRKKYMGFFKLAFDSVNMKMVSFPAILNKYVSSRKKNVAACNSVIPKSQENEFSKFLGQKVKVIIDVNS